MREESPGEPVTAVLLGAGFGTRLAPLTDRVPKPLLEVGGAPIASHLVRRLGTVSDLDKVIVVINDRHPAQFEAWRDSQVEPIAVELLNTGAASVHERNGAVRDMAAAMHSADHVDRRWLVVAGDNLVSGPDLVALEAAGRAVGHAVLCRHVGLHPSGRFGEVVLDDASNIAAFREKPAVRHSPVAATCTYSLGPEAPELLGRYLAEGGEPDAPGSFIAWLSGRAPVRAWLTRGPYHDIGTPRHLADARAAMAADPTASEPIVGDR